MPEPINNTAPQGAVTSPTGNSSRTENSITLKTDEHGVPITTNLVTGKQADGSEIIELKMKPDKPNALLWKDAHSEIDEKTHKNTKVYDLPSGSKIFPKYLDGSKIFYFYNGYYLDLTNFLTFQDLDPTEVVTKSMIGNTVTEEMFKKTLEKYLPIDSYNVRMADYISHADIDQIKRDINTKLSKLPEEAYSKHEINTLLSNLDTYSIATIDKKFAELTSQVIRNNNVWYKSLDGLASINFVRDQLKDYVTKAYLEAVRANIAEDISNTNNRINNFYTKQEIEAKNVNFMTFDQYNHLVTDLVNKNALQAAIQDFVTTNTLANSIKDFVTKHQLTEDFKKYVTNDTLEEKLLHKVDNETIEGVSETFTSQLADYEKKLGKFVELTTLENKIKDFITTNTLESQLDTIRNLFNNYETILNNDAKLSSLRNSITTELAKYLTIERYENEKQNFVSTAALNDLGSSIREDIKHHVTKEYLDTSLLSLKNEFKSDILRTITEEEVDNKLTAVLNALKDVYAKPEIEVIKGELIQQIADLRNYSDNTYALKKDVNKALEEKASNKSVTDSINNLKTEIDLDNKLANLVSNDSLSTTLNDYVTTTTFASGLNSKITEETLKEAVKKSEEKIDTKIEAVKGMINTNSSSVSTLEQSVNSKIQDLKVEQESKNNHFETEIATTNSKFDDYEKKSSVDEKITNVKEENKNKIDALENVLTPKITANTSSITELQKEVAKKVTQLEIDQTKQSLENNITEKITEVNKLITDTVNKFDDYLKTEDFNLEKNKYALKSDITVVENKITEEKDKLKVFIDKNKEEIGKLEDKKLDKSVFEDHVQNTMSKAEILSKIITFDDVFRKTEVNKLIETLKNQADATKSKVDDVSTKVDGMFTNADITKAIKDSSDIINRNINTVAAKLDEKVDKSIYQNKVVEDTNKFNDRPTYAELTSAITNNNKKFKTSDEINNILEGFKISFWNDIILKYTTTETLNNIFSNYTTLEHLNSELEKYTTLETLEKKILDINGVSRDDVIQLIADSELKITNAYKLYISKLLETYTTLVALRDALDNKVDKSVFEAKMRDIERDYLSKNDFNTEKANFVTNTSVYSIVDDKIQTILRGYYDSTKVDELLNSIKNLVISNSSLFYSKEIMDDKLDLLETKIQANNKKRELDQEISNIKGRFSEYPTTTDMEARLNGISIAAANINADSFYNKTNMDTLLLKKLDLDTFNNWKRNVWTSDKMESELAKYVKLENYTTEVNVIKNDIDTLKRNKVLTLNADNVVTTEVLNNTLANYVRDSDFRTSAELVLQPVLGNYVTNTNLETKLSQMRNDLASLNNLTNYVTKDNFNTFKDTVYNKEYVDDIKNSFSRYTTTQVMDSKLRAIESKIKSDAEIIALTQSAGGQNYTKPELNEILSHKIDLTALNNALDLKDTEYNAKYALQSTLNDYMTINSFDTTIKDYLSSSKGGTVVGKTTFRENTDFVNGITTNDVNLTNGNIRNVNDITTSGTATLPTIQSTNVNTTNIETSNNAQLKNVIIKNDGRLTLSQTSISKRDTLDNSPIEKYGVLKSNLGLITQEDNLEFILNVGLRPGNLLSSRMIKFNSDGSLSTRAVGQVDFEGEWTKLALLSDVSNLENTFRTSFVSNMSLNDKLKDYVAKSSFDTTLADYSTTAVLNQRFKSIQTSLERLDIKSYVDTELNKKASRTDLENFRSDMTTGLNNRYSKEELNKIWRPQLMNDVNENLRNNYVSRTALDNTLTSYVTTAALTPMLTQTGIDIMNNINSQFITLTTLGEKLSNYFTKEETNIKLRSYITDTKLSNELSNYTNTEAMNLIHEGMNTQINLSLSTANKTKSALDAFKDTVSTNYFNKDDTATEVEKIVVKKMSPYAKTVDVDAKIEDVKTTITQNKQLAESSLQGVKKILEDKDTEQDGLIAANTAKFNNYVLTTTHTQSVSNERNISDGKYATKVELANYTQRNYVDTELNKKANLTGAAFTGLVSATGFNTTGDINAKQITVTNVFADNILNKKKLLVENQSTLTQENNIVKFMPIYDSNNFGFMLGNTKNKTANEPNGVFIKFNGDKLTYQNSAVNVRSGNSYYDPTGTVHTVATEAFVNEKINTMRTGEIRTEVTQLSSKIDQTKSTLESKISTDITAAKQEVQGKINQVKTDLSNYTTLTKHNQDISAIPATIDAKVNPVSIKANKNETEINKIRTQDLTALETRVKQYADNKDSALETRLKQYVNTEINKVVEKINRALDIINGTEV